MKIKSILIFMAIGITFCANAQENTMPVNKIDSNTLKKLYFDGLTDKLNENFTAASLKFVKIIAADDNNDVAYFELANANLKLNKIAEAESNILKAIQLNANNKWYWLLLAEVYKRQNNMAKLVDVFNKLIKIEADNEIHYYNLAIAQVALNQINLAKGTYQIIEEKFGDSKQLQIAKQQLKQENALPNDGNLLKLLEGNNATIGNYIYAANLLLQKGNTKDALLVLDKAQSLEKDNYEVNLLIADAYRIQKNDERFIDALKRAFNSDKMPLDVKIKIVMGLSERFDVKYIADETTLLAKQITEQNPNDAKVFALYGDVLYQANKVNDALKAYKNSLAINNQIYGVWEQVINLQILLSQYKDAVSTGEEALSLYPNQAKLYYFTAFALLRVGKPKDALEYIKNVYALDSENKNLQSEAYGLEGEIYINQNNFSLAKGAFEKSIALNTENYLVMNNYAYYLALRDDELAKAEILAAKATTGMPGSASIADTYAYVLFKQKKYAQAQTWIEKAIQNNNAKSGVYFERFGDILFMLGKQDEALIKWKKAQELGNGSDVLNKKINEKKYIK
jgi:tetratricopeptide (TPR) repeat protein